MDKHYGWEEDRGSQSAGRFQNGQRWNERNRDDDRGTRDANQGFSGGHYGGFANEGSSSQSEYGGRAAWSQGNFGSEGFSGGGNYGGNRGFSNPGYPGQGYGRPSGQGFAGPGPKGYQRSDERIKELVSDRLMDDDNIDATEITIEVKNGEVTLTGSVNSRPEKRAAEDAAEQTPGVREVQNLLRVQSRESSGGRSASGRQDSFSKSQDSSSSPSKSKNTERE